MAQALHYDTDEARSLGLHLPIFVKVACDKEFSHTERLKSSGRVPYIFGDAYELNDKLKNGRIDPSKLHVIRGNRSTLSSIQNAQAVAVRMTGCEICPRKTFA